MAFTPSYDETREPLEVFAIDEKMNRATGSIPYKSLRWVRRYCEPGEFEMVVPANIYSPDWAFIYTNSRPEMGIIQKVEYQDDSQVYGGIDSVTLSGYFFEVVLNNIVFLVESPEEQKVYVPEPKRPYFQHSKNDSKVYTDGVGTYYYENKSGTYTNATTGQTFTNAEGLSEVDYKPAYGNMYGNPDVGITSYDYYTDSSHEQVTVVPYNPDAGTKTYDILFEDDRGNAYYLNDHGRVTQAVGVVDSYQDTYTARKRSWNALDGDEYGKYYTVTVKGPWQRTDALEPITEGDSVEIVLNWARRMMGDWILYEEPEIEGVQKAVDPSFQYLGDLLYSTLWEVGASLRLEYLFDKNIFILSVYRGFDRTQIEDAEPVAAIVMPTTLAEVETFSEVAPLSDSQALPDGYTRLEYVESHASGATDGQYIDTGIKASSNVSIFADYEYIDVTNNSHCALFGSRGAGSYANRLCFHYNAEGWRFDYNGTNYPIADSAYLERLTLELENGRLSISDGKTAQGSGSFSGSYDIYLFANNTGGTLGECSNVRVYAFDISDGVTSKSLVPAKRDGDGAVGMYDTIGGTFLESSGTGSLTAGPEIGSDGLPVGYDELQYIVTDGSSYIDTGFRPNEDTRAVCKLQGPESKEATWYFASRDATNSKSFGFMWSNGYRADYGNNAVIISGAQWSDDPIVVDRDRNMTYIDGDLVQEYGSATFQGANSLWVAGMNQGGGSSSICVEGVKFFYFKLYDNGELIRDMVPCKSTSGAVGMYDVLNRRLYTSLGSGSFVAGPSVPEPARLTYYPNSTTATGEVAAQEGYVGDSVTVAQNGYTDPNKTFLHWGTLPTGGTTYQPGSSFVLTGMSDALYAQWQENEPEPPEPTPTGGKAPWAVFSDTWGTIYGYDAIRDESNYKNTCYTLYDYDKPDGFDDDGLPSVEYAYSFASEPSGDGVYNATGIEVYIPYTSMRGYYTSRIGEDDEPDIETYLDLRDEKPACDNQWSREPVTISFDDYPLVSQAVEAAREQLLSQGDGSAMPTAEAYETWDADLQTRGETYLRENYGVETTLDTGTVNTRDYLRGWDLGDLVEFEVSTVGLAEQARITEVEEVYESGKVSINVTVGDSQLLRLRNGGA